MRQQSVSAWLDDLASALPAPGGGAAAAFAAASGAALISMVRNLTIGKPGYARHDQVLGKIHGRAIAAATAAQVTAPSFPLRQARRAHRPGRHPGQRGAASAGQRG